MTRLQDSIDAISRGAPVEAGWLDFASIAHTNEGIAIKDLPEHQTGALRDAYYCGVDHVIRMLEGAIQNNSPMDHLAAAVALARSELNLYFTRSPDEPS